MSQNSQDVNLIRVTGVEYGIPYRVNCLHGLADRYAIFGQYVFDKAFNFLLQGVSDLKLVCIKIRLYNRSIRKHCLESISSENDS